jgi:hypothetical protein
MRFEVRYPTGVHHEVELQGTLAVLGRDPACDLVLNDVQCSRRHAVLEAGPQGLAIRDAGSANGVFVNGRKIERSALQPGDLVRVGEVVLKVLPEEMPGTVVMAPDEMIELGPPPTGTANSPGPTGLGTDRTPRAPEPPLASPPAPRPPSAPPPSAPAARPASPASVAPAASAAPPASVAPAASAAPPASAGPSPPRAAPPPVAPRSSPPRPAPAARPVAARPRPIPRGGPVLGRPLTVSVLAGLWLLTALLSIAVGLPLAALKLEGMNRDLTLAAALLLAVLGGSLAFGLWARRSWARPAQIAVAALGLFLCPFSLASATVLIYMMRSDVGAIFEEGGAPPSGKAHGAADGTFVVTIAATVILGVLLSAGGAWIYMRLVR